MIIESTEKLTNAEWKEFLSEQFGISKASAREMLHAMMLIKEKDNLKNSLMAESKGQRHDEK